MSFQTDSWWGREGLSDERERSLMWSSQSDKCEKKHPNYAIEITRKFFSKKTSMYLQNPPACV